MIILMIFLSLSLQKFALLCISFTLANFGYKWNGIFLEKFIFISFCYALIKFDLVIFFRSQSVINFKICDQKKFQSVLRN
jgi:hypothetical protein